MTKRTQKDIFMDMLKVEGISSNEEFKTLIEKQIERLDKKSTNRTPTATQKENVDIKNNIVNALIKIAIPVTISEMQEQTEELQKYSNQKLSALLKQLVADGQVINTKDKKKSLFSVEG